MKMSTVSPTLSSAESSKDALLKLFSFSIGGGGGTSILEGVMTPECVPSTIKCSVIWNTGVCGGPDLFGASPRGLRGDVGWNLNSRFIDPFLPFLCSALVADDTEGTVVRSI